MMVPLEKRGAALYILNSRSCVHLRSLAALAARVAGGKHTYQISRISGKYACWRHAWLAARVVETDSC
jgi:hypothetical protein